MAAFDTLVRRSLPEYRAEGTHLRHVRTGCEVLHLAAADTENLFSFCFTTPPGDDSGVAHIIEHSVLAGSKRYPVKEPFSVLMKGSMHTFLNALTYPDRTLYPAASCNRADFFNCLSVYGDAVFHPLLRKETFMQEAWRMEEAEDGSGASSLRFAGIVFNEMKGARTSADSIAGEWLARGLMPDTPYQFDSGGDPAFIPNLTLAAARAFHGTYYHPSNCRIFLYGNIPLPELLSFLDDNFLSGFTARGTPTVVAAQERWTLPRRLRKTYAVRPETPREGRTIVSSGWLLPEVTDPLALVTHEVISEILVESAGSPLRKALVDSGLGEDLSPVSGLETDLRQMIFAAGLRGTEESREGEITGLMDRTLKGLVSRGLEPGLVEAMINRVELRHREIRGGGSPYALRLMGRAVRGWVHGADPFASLEFTPSLDALKKKLAAGGRWLEEALDRGLVSNPHRLTLVVAPDAEQEARERTAEEARLASRLAAMSAADKETVLVESRAFRAYQNAPDTPAQLATVPSLRRTDLPPGIEKIPAVETRTPAGVALHLHDIFTNEVVSLDFGFPTDALDDGQSLLLPLFGRAVTGMGLPGVGYDAVALDLFRLTGGFSSALDAGGIAGRPDGIAQYMFFRTRCLRANLAAASSLIGRLLAGADFGDHARLFDILVEMRNDMKAALVPAGHQFAMLRAAGMISAAVAREEQWRGVSQLLFLEDLLARGEASLPTLAGSLSSLRSAVLSKGRMIANATAVAATFKDVESAVDQVAVLLPPGPGRTVAAALGPLAASSNGAEALVCSAPVGYVARAIPGFRYEDPRNGAGAVLGHLLSTGYLWEKVRMEGGAYGAFSYPRNVDGLFLFGSYRDPHIVSTLKAFSGSLAFLESGKVDDDEVEKAVIGTVGKEDRPIDPGEKGFVSLQRSLHGLTDAARQARRTGLLAVDRDALRAAAGALAAGFERGSTAVIANKRALDDAAAEVPGLGARILQLPE